MNKMLFLILTLSFVGTGLAMQIAERPRRLARSAKELKERYLAATLGYAPMEAEATPETPVPMEAEATQVAQHEVVPMEAEATRAAPGPLEAIGLTAEQVVQLITNPQELYNQYQAAVQERKFLFNQLEANPKADATEYILAQKRVEALQKLLDLALAAHRGK